MTEIEAVLLDVEGCVTEPGGDKVPWPILPITKLSSLVNTLGARGVPVALCTGRQGPFAGAVGQALGVKGQSLVENGAFVYDHATGDAYINPVITQNVQAEFRELRQRIDTDILPKIKGRREIGKEWCISLNPPARIDIESYFNIVASYFDKTVAGELSGYSVQIAHSMSAVDITPPEVSKASGVRFWSEKTGISLDSVLGVGDSGGDKSWLELVGYKAGPANATEGIRALPGCHISQSRTTKGVMEILYTFFPKLREEVEVYERTQGVLGELKELFPYLEKI